MNIEPVQPVQPIKSELRALLAQIDAEYEASRQAIYGLAEGVAKHRFLNARTERLGGIFEEMSALIGDQAEAMQLFAAQVDKQEGGQIHGTTFC